MRTFIAVKLDEAVKSKLNFLLDRLRRVEKSVKWVGPEGLHLTTKFLGEVDEAKIREIEDALALAARDTMSFPLTCKGTGTFPPSFRNARVVWAGIVPDKDLMALQARLEDDLEILGFPREGRAFHPHITLGRMRFPSGLGSQAVQVLEKERETLFGVTAVKKITFFRSELKPTGAEYSVVSEFDLT